MIWLLKISGSSATALPGLIILRLFPRFLEETIGKYPKKIIIVTGTNGKTTTAHLLVHLLRKSGKKVFHNPEGSNMERGIASEILKCISVGAHPARLAARQGEPLQYDYYVIEADEGTFPNLLQILKPQTVILLNIFRDQLDRYGEINSLMAKWSNGLKENLPEKIIFNSDDPNITKIIQNLKKNNYGFSVMFSDNVRSFNADRIFCPHCNGILKFSENNFYCLTCGFKKIKAQYILRENLKLEFNGEPIGLPLLGKYNYYNLAAALTTYFSVGAEHVQPLQQLLHDFHPAFGRFEKIKYKNHFFYLILAKNPAGMDNVLMTLQGDMHPTNLLMCLNDKIADGEDVSWIYDVDFENLFPFSVGAEHVQPLRLTFSGTRAYDLALRLKIAEKLPIYPERSRRIEPDMQVAFENFLVGVENSNVSAVIATYTCLLELQKIMYRKKLIKKIM